MKRVKRILLNNLIIKSEGSHSGILCYKNIARWHGPDVDCSAVCFRPAVVSDILVVKYFYKEGSNNLPVDHYLVKCKWLKEHVHKDFYGKSIILKIRSTEYENYSAASVIPLKNILGHLVCVQEKLRFNCIHVDLVNIVINLPLKSY